MFQHLCFSARRRQAGSGAARKPLRRGHLCSALDRIHRVDKSLLLFMAALLIQPVYSIFAPAAGGQSSGDIDIIARTSSAAIFGYFLSANFIRHTTSGQAPSGQQDHILETGPETAQPAAPRAQIDFSAGDAQAQHGKLQTQQSPPANSLSANCLQVAVATSIGLFCLIALLLLRNLEQWGIALAQSDSATAAVIQFLDFVSSCIEFLIGYPTQTNSPTP